MPRYPRRITKLSQLEIDVDKDWAAKKIENLGAPDTGDDAPRDDTIDSKITTHKGDASAHHAKTTSIGDLTDHDRAAHDALGTGATVFTDETQTLTNKTLGGALTLNGQAFDAGSGNAEINTTGAGAGLLIKNIQGSTNGAILVLEHISETPAANDNVGILYYKGRDSNLNDCIYGYQLVSIVNPVDGSETARQEWYLFNNGTNNEAMILSGAGALECDASITGDAFDEFDDAIILKRGISERQLEVLESIGVMKRKDTGSGWMLNFQKMMYLLAGGIYQTRTRVDRLDERLSKLEALAG